MKEDYEEGGLVRYEASGKEVTLSRDIVKSYLTKGNGEVTDQEVELFIQLCRYRGLNPFLGEAHLIKYGNNPAQVIVGKEYFTRAASKHPDYQGCLAGVVVRERNGKLTKRRGTLILPEEELVGGWATIKRRGRIDFEHTVSLREYIQYHYDEREKKMVPNANWKKMPATMIRKVALVQALREVFPELFGGLYSPEEMPVDMRDAETPLEALVESSMEEYPEPEEEIYTEATEDVISRRQPLYEEVHPSVASANFIDPAEMPPPLWRERFKAVAVKLRKRYQAESGIDEAEVREMISSWSEKCLGKVKTDDYNYMDWNDLLWFLERLIEEAMAQKNEALTEEAEAEELVQEEMEMSEEVAND